MSLLYGLKVSVLTSCQALKDIYILTQVKENAQNTCPWPFMVPVMGLMTFALSNQRHACCLVILCPLKQYFSHAMIMDGWLKS